MGNPYNSVKITFSTPNEGIITKQGISGEFTGEDMSEFYKISNCFYEKHTGAMMLRPVMRAKDMAISNDIVSKYPDEEIFKEKQILGKPYGKNIIHQFNASKMNWGIKTGTTVEEGQGVLVWYAKRPKREDEVPMTILLADEDVPEAGVEAPDIDWWKLVGKMIMLEITSEEITLKQSFKVRSNPNGFPATYGQEIEEWKLTPPEHFLQKEGELEWTTIAIFFVENSIIVGVNGLEATERKIAKHYNVETDETGKAYASVMPEGSRLWMWGGGVAYMGWQALQYETEGILKTDVYESPEPLSMSTVETLKKTVPEGTSIETGGKTQGKVTGSELFYLQVDLKGSGAKSPFLYRFRIKSPVRRSSGSPDSIELEGDVLECSEGVSANMDGSFGSGSLQLMINCSSYWYNNIFEKKNSHIKCEFTLYNKDGVEVVEGYYADIVSIERPQFGKFKLTIEASPITKRLQMLPILQSESYDYRGFNHVDLVEELCDKAGVKLTADTDAGGVLLPVSEDARNPNWQYQRGVKFLEALNNVRQFSGWCMYPKGRRTLYYKKRPSSTDSADYDFDMESDAFTNIRYERADGFRTRFLVMGMDKDGQGVMSYDLDSGLEDEIGESRPVVVIDPKLATLDACETMKNGLMAYYTEEQFYARFRIERFENYFGMKLFDIVRITDAKTPEINGKYMVLAINWNIKQHLCSADIELKSLWE